MESGKPAQQGYGQGYQPPYPGGVQYNQNAPGPTVIVRQSQAQPNDYLPLALFVTLCCCLPFGIIAIVKSMDVRNRTAAGDPAGAEEASRSSKCWSIAGLVTGIVFYVIGVIAIIIYVVFVVTAVTTASNTFNIIDNN